MYNLEKRGPCTFVMPKEGGMRVPGLIIASEELIEEVEINAPLDQVRNVAFLPGIIGYSIAMPDIHWGYGFPIGGVAAMDAETGVISPGGVGYDINCGVRLALAPMPFKELKESQKKELLHAIYKNVPSGVGHGTRGKGLSETDYNRIAEMGSRWAIEHGCGFTRDLEHTESNGVLAGAGCETVSALAKDRAKNQLGSIGSGNHFVEIGEIQQIFLPDIATAWNIELGQTYILIHSGSRGFGHQICTDTLHTFVKKGFAEGLPDRQLVAAPINSPEGQNYFRAMATAANFAFNNRQFILHHVRKSFQETLGTRPEDIPLLYDVCHNIAKFEEHLVDGKRKRVCVHRKGATRAFGKGNKELAPIFQATGQPVLIPGDMGRASHLLVGLGNPLTWCSAPHGAGRARSRIKSMQSWKNQDPIRYMEKQGVHVMANSYRTIAEEMPDAYKNVDMVVAAAQEAGLANMVVRLKPHLVIKG